MEYISNHVFQPIISVIMPVYNSEKYLGETDWAKWENE